MSRTSTPGASSLRNQIQKLKETKKLINERYYDGFDIEFNGLTTPDIRNSYSFATAEKLPELNRYSDVLANEQTRVKLLTNDGTLNDYINANYIPATLFGTQTDYIACQGPLDRTIADFWNMVYQTKAHVIVMLASEIETGRVKCAKYWPDQAQSKEYSLRSDTQDDIPLTVTTTSQNFEPSSKEEIVIREIEIKTGEERHQVTMIQYVGWPDHGVPKDPMSFVRVLTCANDALKKHSEKLMIVHCSAGIGRSGTFITVDVILQQMLEAQKRETGLEWNVMGVVRDLRRVRAGMVQMKSQYMFLYEVLLAEAEKIKF